MSDWVVDTLGNICDAGNGVVQTGPFGSQLHESDYQETGVPVVMPKDIINGKIDESSIARVSVNHLTRLSKHRLSLGDIIYGRRGDIGRQALVREKNIDWLCGSGCVRITLGKGALDSQFLHLYLQLPEVVNWVANQAIGATLPNLNTKIIRSIPIRYPINIHNQKQLVAILTAYDDLIENNRRRIALLEQMAESIYREWFVRMRFPGHAMAKIEQGVPVGWERKNLGELCLLQRGYDLPDSEVVPGDYPVMASTSIKTYHNQYKVEPPVITTGRSGSLGIVLFSDSRAWPLNTTLYVKEFFGNSPYLIYFTLKNIPLEKFNSGAGVPTLNRNHLTGVPISIPPQNLQCHFEAIVSPIYKQARLLEKHVDILKQSRDLLLPRLLSGKLAVDALDIQCPTGMKTATG